MKKSAIIAILTAMTLWGCDLISNGEEGKKEDVTMEYTSKQSRSPKRGISGPMRMATDITLLAPGVCWQYNWGATIGWGNLMKANDMVFYPMSWNNNLTQNDVRNLKHDYPEIEYILAYNEPNLKDQANMTPSVAAGYWGSLKALADELGLKIIAPAVNYGTLEGYSDPIKWLDEFFACDGVSLDDVAGLAIHCYMPTGESLKKFVQLFYKYDKPIYMTEFCAASGTITNDVNKQAAFMADVLNYLESDPHVGGYSWFMSRGSGNWAAISLLNSSATEPALTDLGQLYVNFSSFDKNAWYSTSEAIPAANYSSNNMSQSATKPGWEHAPRARATTDSTGVLELCDFYAVGSWVEYQIDVAEAATYSMLVRYSNQTDGKFALAIDGTELCEFTLASTTAQDKWATEQVDNIALSAGHHTMRLTLRKGRANFNWFYFKK